jgi:hypothetical protein
MTASAIAGPLIVYGQNPSQASTNYVSDYNADSGPSAFANGTMLLDPRYGYRASLTAGQLAAIGFLNTSEYLVIDQVPTIKAVANIAAAAATVSGTPMALVSTTGAGITVGTASLVAPQSGITLPSGALFIENAPALILYGPQGTTGALDPRTTIARALSVTANAAATGGNITIAGWDVFGFPMTETIVAAASTTVNGKKAFKAIGSVTPGVTDAGHTYSVGTTDIFGFPLASYFFQQVEIYWNNAEIVAATGFTAAVATTATATTGDVRGTYATQDASDGTKRLQVSCAPTPYSLAATNGASSLFGMLQF